MPNKSCFVIMPIGRPDTDDYSHFRVIFSNIKSIMQSHGYDTIRADDVQKAGAITKDIVRRLGDSDLVIADLTNLNPNVFYELGVRHALRGRGTLMILDSKRTPDIPFDLSAYRVIKFSGDLAGVDALFKALAEFLVQMEGADRDNPVHDWFPELPPNILEVSSQSSGAALRKENKVLQDRLAQYEKAYGRELTKTVASGATPLSSIMSAIAVAQDGLMPATVLDEMRGYVEARDTVKFLNKVRVIVERDIRLNPTIFIQLALWASRFELGAVTRAIYEQALQMHPDDENLQRSYLARLSHSEDKSDRETARREIPKHLSFPIDKDPLPVADGYLLDRDLELLGFLTDAFHRDGMHEEALVLTRKLFDAFPKKTRVVRNYARALDKHGNPDQAIEFHRLSILVPDVDDTSARWFGSELHNRRRHRDASEAFALGCTLDYLDANNFRLLAGEIAIMVSEGIEYRSERGGGDDFPTARDEYVALFHCAQSCNNLDAEGWESFRTGFESMELEAQAAPQPLNREQRRTISLRIYNVLKTELTSGPADRTSLHGTLPANVLPSGKKRKVV